MCHVRCSEGRYPTPTPTPIPTPTSGIEPADNIPTPTPIPTSGIEPADNIPTSTPTPVPQGILLADISISSISPVFGAGILPAQMGQLGIHTGDGDYPPTIDVVPAYAEACIDAGTFEEKTDACRDYADEAISVYAPLGGYVVSDVDNIGVAIELDSTSSENRPLPRIEIHLRHLRTIYAAGQVVVPGQEIGKLCTRQEAIDDHDHTLCALTESTETHLAIQVRMRLANGIIDKDIDTTYDLHRLLRFELVNRHNYPNSGYTFQE
jgi:hypothetical protein